MKRTFILTLLIMTPFLAHSKSVCVDANPTDIAIVETYVPDAQKWLQEAWKGKVHKRKETMIKEEVDRSIQNSEVIPAGDDAIIHKAMTRPDYKTRKQRDLEPQN